MSANLVHQCLITVITVGIVLYNANPSLAVIDGQSQPFQQRSLPQFIPEHCPTNCSCFITLPSRPVITIDCQNQSLSSMPKNISTSVTELIMNSNSIFTLHNELKNLDNLEILNLSRNRLSILDERTFSDLSKLKYLDLSANVLKSSTPVEIFEGIPYLLSLNLSANSFKHISNNLFNGLRDLQYLDLSSNGISGMDRDALKDLWSLHFLDLSNNRLDMIEIEWFQSLQNLNTLKLNNNQLTRISNTVFWNLKGLKTLDISKNFITAIGYLSFRGLNQVTTLDLSTNNFTNLQEGTLKPMEKLHTLDLSSTPLMTFDGLFSSSDELETLYMYNMYRLESINRESLRGLSKVKHIHLIQSHLIKIDRYAFETLTQLQVLDLRSNNLTSIPRNLFENLKMIETIHLEGNPWNCDCLLHWILRWLGDSHHSHVLAPLDTVCKSPQNLIGMPILDALDHHLVCINANVSSHSPVSSFKLGSSATLYCKPSGYPLPTLTWVTPNNLMFHWSEKVKNRTEPPDLSSYIDNSEHRIAHTENHNSLEEGQLGRYSLLKNGSLVVHNIQHGDSGIYRCIVSNALRNTTVGVPLQIDLMFRVEIQVMSILVGMATSFGFLFLTLLIVVIEMILEHFGIECPCVTNTYKAKQIRKMLETMETYKSQQLEWLKDNYTSQAQRVKDNCMQQMEKLRESYSSQVEKLRDIRDYGTLQIDRIRDNYYNQVQRVRDYSTSQIDRLRENYVFQRNRVRKFSAHQFIRFRENYKMQQLHLNKILENLNLESCKSNCNRTDSMIFEPEMLVDGVFQMPALEGLSDNFPDTVLPAPIMFRDGLETESQLSAYYTPEDSRSLVSTSNKGDKWETRLEIPTKRDVGVSTSDLDLEVVMVHQASHSLQPKINEISVELSENIMAKQNQLLEENIAEQSQLIDDNIAEQSQLIDNNIAEQNKLLEDNIAEGSHLLEPKLTVSTSNLLEETVESNETMV